MQYIKARIILNELKKGVTYYEPLFERSALKIKNISKGKFRVTIAKHPNPYQLIFLEEKVMSKKMKSIISIVLVVITVFGTFVITASAASYSTGNYVIAASNGSNVRSGAGTGYSRVGAASKGVTFYVSRVNGSWGYTSSIKCTNGTKSGWVCLDYCTYKGSSNNSSRATYNDVFASLKGSGYSLSQARNTEATSFKKGDFVYVWGWLHDINGNLYKSYGSGTCNMTLSIYRPNGSCAFTYTYKNCDTNWIGQKLDQEGTWKIQSKITGSLVGTNTRSITVKNSSSTIYPSSVGINYTSCTMNVGNTKQLYATVYPTNATNKAVYWSSSNSQIVSVSSSGKLTAKAPGVATITAKTSNGKTRTCQVTVRGVEITGSVLFNYPTVGDVYYLSAKAYPSNTTKFTWSTSNSKIVSVSSSGKMTAKASGTATITVKTSDGRSGSIRITVGSANKWKTGNFDSGYTAKGYTTVTLNKNVGNAKIKIYTYDGMGLKSSGQVHVTLRDWKGNWICEFDAKSGDTLNLGNNYGEYRVYIAKKKYPNTVTGNSDNWINMGKCQSWAIECTKNCYI